MTIIEELEWRGFLYQMTSEELPKVLSEEKLIPYIGFDPSASSLHVGNLVPLMYLLHFRRHGHQVIPLLGGGTGLIGDPSGKSKERPLLDKDAAAAQGAMLHKQMQQVLENVDGPDIILQNNIDWLDDIKLIDFLRDFGKHFSVNEMMRRDSVQMRFQEEQASISFTEFSYMLLQAYDFLELYRRTGCRLQSGASDQWGNIVSGVDLVRRIEGVEVYGLTMPLLLKADGKKFGKSETGSVWLDPDQTSPYAFYQFWINAADEDVERYLKLFTLLDKDAIGDLVATIGSPERTAQKALAAEVTTLIHGQAATDGAIAASQALFSGNLAELPVDQLKAIASDVPSLTIAESDLSELTVFDLLVRCEAASSKSEAKRFVEQGGVKFNGDVIAEDRTVTKADFRDGEVLVVQRGKKGNFVVLLA